MLDFWYGAPRQCFPWWPPRRHILLSRVSISLLRLTCTSSFQTCLLVLRVCNGYTYKCSCRRDSHLDLSIQGQDTSRGWSFNRCWTLHCRAHDYMLLYYEWMWIHKKLIRIVLKTLYPNNGLYIYIYILDFCAYIIICVSHPVNERSINYYYCYYTTMYIIIVLELLDYLLYVRCQPVAWSGLAYQSDK